MWNNKWFNSIDSHTQHMLSVSPHWCYVFMIILQAIYVFMWEYFKKHQNLLTNASIYPCLSMAFPLLEKKNIYTKAQFCTVLVNFPNENPPRKINIYEYKWLFNFWLFFALQNLFWKNLNFINHSIVNIISKKDLQPHLFKEL